MRNQQRHDTGCEPSDGAGQSANYNNAAGDLTDVGAYTGTTSPYGAFDMGGDVAQWNEALIVNSNGTFRSQRGFAFSSSASFAFNLRSTSRYTYIPTAVTYNAGFRVASVPSVALILAATSIAMGT